MLVIGFAILAALAARAAASDAIEIDGIEEVDEIDGIEEVDEIGAAALEELRDGGDGELGASSEIDASSELALAHGGAGFDLARAPRPSWWGRIDLAVSWRRRIDDAPGRDKRRDEVWLLAVWSR